jgi:hypothetical protein
MPIITLLRNAAMNSLKYKSELALVKAQNIDITNFEERAETFKNAFAKNYDLASGASRRPSTRSTSRSTTCRRPRRRCSAPTATCAWRTTRRRT